MEIDAFIYFDGATKGNPGHSGAGVVIEKYEAGVISQITVIPQYLGILTAFEAEWEAAIIGLTTALNLGYKHITLAGDGTAVVQQFDRISRMTNFGPLEKVQSLLQQFTSYDIWKIYREENGAADAAANLALDGELGNLDREKAAKTRLNRELNPFVVRDLRLESQADGTEAIIKGIVCNQSSSPSKAISQIDLQLSYQEKILLTTFIKVDSPSCIQPKNSLEIDKIIPSNELGNVPFDKVEIEAIGFTYTTKYGDRLETRVWNSKE